MNYWGGNEPGKSARLLPQQAAKQHRSYTQKIIRASRDVLSTLVIFKEIRN